MDFINKSKKLVKDIKIYFVLTISFFVLSLIGILIGSISTIVISGISLLLLFPACYYAIKCINRLGVVMNFKCIFAIFKAERQIDDILLDKNKFEKNKNFEIDVYNGLGLDNKNEVYAMIFNPNTLSISDINKLKFNMDRIKKRVYIFFKNSKEYEEYSPKIKSFSNIEFLIPVIFENDEAKIFYKIIEFRNKGFNKIQSDFQTLFDMKIKDIISIEKK